MMETTPGAEDRPETGAGVPRSPAGARFATTRWSLVLAAADRTAPGSREALEALCRIYWYPLYAFLRRRGHHADEAQDFVQGFFTGLLAADSLRAVRPERGRFRSYLLGALKHFLEDERDRARAAKRGGGREPLRLDLSGAEERWVREPSHDLTPERLYERRWALALLEEVLRRLRVEHELAGKTALFDGLKAYLTGGEGLAGYREAGEGLGLSEGAVKVAVHRLRRRYRDLLREEIAGTLADSQEVEDEVRHLFAVLGS